MVPAIVLIPLACLVVVLAVFWHLANRDLIATAKKLGEARRQLTAMTAEANLSFALMIACASLMGDNFDREAFLRAMTQQGYGDLVAKVRASLAPEAR